MRSEKILRGALFLILGEALLVLMGALVKEVESEIPFAVKVFFRNLFGWLFIILFLFLTGKTDIKTKVLHWHFFRSAVGLCGMYGFFYVIDHMKLAEASLVKLTAPLFLPLIAFFWLKERINWNHTLALAVGFVGVGFILQPGTIKFQPIAFIGLAAAFFQSLAKVTIRKMSLTEPYGRVIFYFGLFGSLISLVPALYYWETPPIQIFPLLLLLGASGTAGQIFVTRAYQIASPGKVGAYTYTQIIFASLLGYLYFDENLEWYIFVGSGLIIFAGLINLYNRTKKETKTKSSLS